MARVSVVIPTYNRKAFIQEALNSVLDQSYLDYEVIVVDDGSTDNTGEMIQNTYGMRVHYYWQHNQGESVARNKGIELANGEYIAFLDSDVDFLSGKLSICWCKRLSAISEGSAESIFFTLSFSCLINSISCVQTSQVLRWSAINF